MLSPNTILRNRYRIIQLLGHGGMGAVYQAIDENLNRLVAVKEAFGSSEELRRAFRREAELLGNLRHRALPKSIEHFSENSNDYFVMEFIPGNDLGELLKLRANPFPESDVLGWADEVLGVLAYLHGQGLVHRDIKPSNMKLTKEGELFLIDFGLAKGAVGQMGTLVTSQSVRGYTPAYASLEQILGQGTDARSDIYSVGATFYHLLAGVAPVDASTRFQKLDDEGNDPLPLIQHENPLVSPHVAGIIHSAMAINRRRRPESAEQMREALRSHKTGEPTLKTPSSSASQPGPTQPSPTQPSPLGPTPVAPPVVTMPVSHVTKPPPVYSNRIFSVAEVPDERQPDSASFAKPLLIGIAVILFLVAASVGAVSLKTGWVPWRSENIYGNGQTDGTSNPNNNANTSPVLVTSASPDKPVTQTPSPGSVVLNRIGMELVWISPGSFMMGSTNGDERERPVHDVRIDYPFYIGKYEVTQAQWQAVMAGNPAAFKDCGGNCPVELVSWEDAQKFIQQLNEMKDEFTYRLPTEAEWEYAARAGTTGDYAGALDSIAWYANNSGNNYFDADKSSQYDPTTAASMYAQQLSRNGNRPHAVGTKQANGFGLFDMSGNVTEWCEDVFHNSYVGAPTDGSAWVTGGERGLRVSRGGAWYLSARASRSSFRSQSKSDDRLSYSGLRVVAIPRSR